MKKKAKQDVLTALCAAVAAKYQSEGDRIKAGVVVACLSYEPPRYYASVARYPDSPHVKEIVCQVGKREQVAHATADAAVRALAAKWYEDNQPVPVKPTIDALGALLDGK